MPCNYLIVLLVRNEMIPNQSSHVVKALKFLEVECSLKIPQYSHSEQYTFD